MNTQYIVYIAAMVTQLTQLWAWPVESEIHTAAAMVDIHKGKRGEPQLPEWAA